MILTRFQVHRFRNIVDSGPIYVDSAVTCLVGKNEAGKSALIEALYLFNPAYGEKFDVEDQYPRWLAVQDRRVGDLAEQTPISVTLKLESEDKEAVGSVLGDGVIEDEATVSRKYGGGVVWKIQWDEAAAMKDLVAAFPTTIRTMVKECNTLDSLRERLRDIEPTENGSEGPTSEDLESATEALQSRGLENISVRQRIVDLLKPQLPRFFRFTNYSTLPGRIDFRELAADENERPGRSDLQTARALLQLARTDLDQLGNEAYELRKGELEAVQIDLTNQVFEYWKQNPELEVNIDVDKETVNQGENATAVVRYLDIRLRDKRSGYSNNFTQRSSGFQWFFSFLAAFSQFEEENSPIVLLYEPALNLHGRAQGDFLRFINERLAPSTPVIYTTHSPFMVEPDRLERVRIVEDHGPPNGATATVDMLTADRDSLFPLQAALGYDIAQNLFVGPHNLLVESTSDYIYLTVMSRLSAVSEGPVLDERWRIIPAGGATNIPTFVSLIGPHLDITVLVDSNAKGMQRVKNMVSQGLLAGHRLILASVATDSKNADIEDLFTEGDYLKLYNKTFNVLIKVGDLPKGDRLVLRLEDKCGGFDHGEVAETLLRDHNEISLTETTLKRFQELIATINTTIET